MSKVVPYCPLAGKLGIVQYVFHRLTKKPAKTFSVKKKILLHHLNRTPEHIIAVSHVMQKQQI